VLKSKKIMFRLLISFLFSLYFFSTFEVHVFSQNILTPDLLWKYKRLSGGKVSPDQKKILFEIREFNVSENSGNTDLYVLDIKTNDIKKITNTPFSEIDACWGKNNQIWFLSSEKGGIQLWKMNENGEEKIQISNFKKQEIEGFKLSPDEKNVLVLSPIKTKSNLKDKYPDLPKANARLEDDLMYRHWNYWNDEFKKQLFLHELSNDGISENGINLLQGEIFDGVMPPFSGMEDVAFSISGKSIVYATKKKTGKEFALSTNSDLYEFNIKSKTTRNITENYKGYDVHPQFSLDGSKIAWLSMKNDGFEADKNDIILRDLVSGIDVNLTQKVDLTVSDFCFDKSQQLIYFISPTKGTKQLFSIDLNKNTITQVTEGKFDIVSLDLTSNALFFGRQSMTEATDLFSMDVKTRKTTQLTEINKNLTQTIHLPSTEERWIETSDGQKMLTWIVYPPDFDKTKKYPTLLYCQGGPQSMVSQFFSYRWNLALMASQGYIVIAPNRRGLPGFGQKWNDDISKDWGGQAMRDYLSAVDEIAKEPYVNKDKMGAVGASYGGYSVFYLAGIHQGRFKTFISHCGLFNLESWYGTTEELFFANWDIGGPYWLPENKEFYAKNSPHNFVKNWDTPILVIQGGVDFRVPESEGMQAFQVAQLKGLKSKYLVFPKEGHWVNSPQNAILWQREFFEWLDSDLK
jgi:dipeptidyl aminopeptidase/acylaminoacyl peptidase